MADANQFEKYNPANEPEWLAERDDDGSDRWYWRAKSCPLQDECSPSSWCKAQRHSYISEEHLISYVAQHLVIAGKHPQYGAGDDAWYNAVAMAAGTEIEYCVESYDDRQKMREEWSKQSAESDRKRKSEDAAERRRVAAKAGPTTARSGAASSSADRDVQTLPANRDVQTLTANVAAMADTMKSLVAVVSDAAGAAVDPSLTDGITIHGGQSQLAVALRGQTVNERLGTELAFSPQMIQHVQDALRRATAACSNSATLLSAVSAQLSSEENVLRSAASVVDQATRNLRR